MRLAGMSHTPNGLCTLYTFVIRFYKEGTFVDICSAIGWMPVLSAAIRPGIWLMCSHQNLIGLKFACRAGNAGPPGCNHAEVRRSLCLLANHSFYGLSDFDSVLPGFLGGSSGCDV